MNTAGRASASAPASAAPASPGRPASVPRAPSQNPVRGSPSTTPFGSPRPAAPIPAAGGRASASASPAGPGRPGPVRVNSPQNPVFSSPPLVPFSSPRQAKSSSLAGAAKAGPTDSLPLTASGTETSYLRYSLTDGRTLAYQLTGSSAPNATTVLYFKGIWPSRNAGREFGVGSFPSDAPVRVVCVDRPGVGRSSAHAESGFVSFAADLAALLGYLRVQGILSERFFFLAYSGGAPFALAAAQYFAHTAGVPKGLGGVAIMAGLPTMSLPVSTVLYANSVPTFPALVTKIMIADQKIAERQDIALAGNPASTRSGSSTEAAMLKDARRVLATWPVETDKLVIGHVPVYLWYSDSDEIIPWQTAEQFAAVLRGARAKARPGPLTGREHPALNGVFLTKLTPRGHSSILQHVQRILGGLVRS